MESILYIRTYEKKFVYEEEITMINKKSTWYLGYLVAAIIVLILCVTDLPKAVDLALSILFASIFSVTHVQILHKKMLVTDKDYKILVMDERDVAIKEKAGNITNMVNMVLMGCATVVFIALDYIVPAVILGVIVFIQPVILIVTSNCVEKKL